MNPIDPFEEKLRQQAFRSIPKDWKDKILPREKDTPPEPSSFVLFWHSLFYPWRHAYAGLALLWALTLFFHLNTPGPLPQESTKPSHLQAVSEAEDSLGAWQQRQRLLSAAGYSNSNLEIFIR